jgi:hypothetical protein
VTHDIINTTSVGLCSKVGKRIKILKRLSTVPGQKIRWLPSVMFRRLFRKWEQDKIFMQESHDHLKLALPQVQETVSSGGQNSTHKLQTGQRKPLMTLWRRKVRTTSVTSRMSCDQRTVLLLEQVPESISSSLRVADLKVEINIWFWLNVTC